MHALTRRVVGSRPVDTNGIILVGNLRVTSGRIKPSRSDPVNLSPLEPILTKSAPANSFRSHTYAKQGEGVGVILRQTPLLIDLRVYDRQRNVTGPSIGCAISAPVLRASIKFAFNAKYHFAGRSASSMSISRGLCFNPSACRIIVS